MTLVKTIYAPMLIVLLCGACTGSRDLVDTIRHEQSRAIRKSTGTEASQCFTDDNLAAFVSSDKPRQVAAELKNSSAFRKLVDKLKKMPPADRDALLAKARKTAQPTWAEQGAITTDGSGQTEAGQKAQLLLANAIVDAAVELIGEKQ